MNQFVDKLIRHDFALNSLEQSEDKTVIKFKACVLDFLKSHNGWAISKSTCEKRMHTLVNKHIVVRYYSEEENGGLDAFGDHEETSVKLRGTDIMLPATKTHSIGTITNAYIDYVEPNSPLSGEAVWIDGVILAMENINEASLLLEWHENNIPILTSVEWYYTQDMYDNEGTQWIVDPTFSNLCILNSEARGDKPIIYGNYDCSHIELMVNQLNQAVKDDLAINNKHQRKDDDMENVFLKALNDISFGQIRSKIYSALSKVMVASEYERLWISDWDVYDTYFIYETYDGENWIKFKVEYTKTEDDEIEVNYEDRKQVERQDVYVEVQVANNQLEEIKTELNTIKEEKANLETQLNEKAEEIISISEEKVNLNETIVALNSKISELEPFKAEYDKAEFDKALIARVEELKPKFVKFNGLDVFESEEVQSLVKDTLDVEKALNAKLAIYEKLDEVIGAFNIDDNSNTGNGVVGMNTKSLNNLVPDKKDFVSKYGFDC